jgi:solute carrier family 25 phosphate transporter 23/24/25/41
VEAAAAVAAWEDEERKLQEFGYDEYEEEYEEEEEEEVVMRPAKLLLAGGIAGAVSRTATAPLDRLKMLLQVHEGQTRMTIASGLRRMAAEGTVKAFFKGNGANVLKIAPETAIKLTMNDIYKRLIAHDPEEITPGQRMMAGALAGATAQSVIYPLEMVKTRLAVCPSNQYKGIFDTMSKVYRQEGWKAFYRGMLPSMLGILPYAGVDITAFELLKEWLIEEYDGSPPPHMILGAGMLSSSLAQFSAYPLALVRTRLQAQGIGGRPSKYRGMSDVLSKTYRNEGFRGLYKGSMTNLAKLAPAAGISWFVFEETKMLLGISMRS